MIDLTPFVFVILMIPCLFILYNCSKKKYSNLEKFMIVSFYIYLIFLFSKTFLPLPINELDKIIFKNMAIKNNYIPFKSIIEIITTSTNNVIIYQIGGNILLTIPLGFFLPIIYKNINLAKAMKIGLAVAVGIEIMQGVVSKIIGIQYRSIDVDDILLNIIGTIIGYLIYKIFNKIIYNKVSNRITPVQSKE